MRRHKRFDGRIGAVGAYGQLPSFLRMFRSRRMKEFFHGVGCHRFVARCQLFRECRAAAVGIMNLELEAKEAPLTIPKRKVGRKPSGLKSSKSKSQSAVSSTGSRKTSVKKSKSAAPLRKGSAEIRRPTFSSSAPRCARVSSSKAGKSTSALGRTGNGRATPGDLRKNRSEADVVRKAEKPKKKKKKKKEAKPGVLDVSPMNISEMKDLFLSGVVTNPVFEYKDPSRAGDAFRRFGTCSYEYYGVAKYILDKVIAEYGNESTFLEVAAGRIVSREETEHFIRQYLQDAGLQNEVCYKFSEGAVAPTSMTGETLTVRLPVQYREGRLRGILDHEIGTHFMRRVNERKMPWHRRRQAYALEKDVATEEGLATLNTHLHTRSKYLFMAALHYYSCCQAQTMSFRELFHSLEKYVDDPERRWYECVRVKRGLEDTTLAGSFCKDQAYLSGAVRILKMRRTLDFRLLYCGKVALDDLERVRPMVDEGIIELPYFLMDRDEYLRRLDEISAANGIAFEDEMG